MPAGQRGGATERYGLSFSEGDRAFMMAD